MRVVWFSHYLPAAVQTHLGMTPKGSGYWVDALLRAVRQTSAVDVTIVTAARGMTDLRLRADGADYVVVGQRRRRFGSSQCTESELNRCAAAVESLAPDLVHVHGAEWFYGLLAARRLIAPPVLVSLQGVLQAFMRVFWGGMTPWDRIRFHAPHQLLFARGLFRARREAARRCREEREVLEGCHAFAGRTAWDRAQLRAVNPAASYFHVGEVLRPEFHRQCWKLEACRRHSIVFTNARGPRRGVEILLDAVAILKRQFPDVSLQLGGLDRNGVYGKFLLQRIRALDIAGHVELPGYLSGDEIVRLLTQSHVFVLPSHMENSPNSLCEAQAIGMPCVAGYVGGVPDLVQDGTTGLLFPHGDAATLADAVRQVFDEDRTAVELGQQARLAASVRHDPRQVTQQLLDAYAKLAPGSGVSGGTPARGKP